MSGIEKPYRSIVKTFSWRIIATVSTIFIAFIITGRMELAFSIGIFEFISKLFLYYGHERVWARLKFGLKKPPDYQI